MARSGGIARTVAKIKGRLETDSPTGYSVAGITLAVGDGIKDIQPGDRVAAAGTGVANHAEYVDVPRNLVIQIPDDLGFRSASTVALGGIALHAVRRAEPQLGDYGVVFGTGLLGQLALQMLVKSGARAIAVDLEDRRLDLACQMGAELRLNPQQCDPVKAIHHYTNGHGADVVLFCAATANSQALADAFAMTRKKGRVVVVGVWGREVRREDLYAKELDFLISTSYGPGRYDPAYEEGGLDYPYAYVRWTENRNMEEYLRLLAARELQVEPLIEGIFPVKEVEQAFSCLQGPNRPLIILLDYGDDLPDEFSVLVHQTRSIENRTTYRPSRSRRLRVGLIGAGAFATAVHLPNLQKLKKKYEIRAICNRAGSKAQAVARQFGAKYASTDYREILQDQDTDLVMICTRHNLHGQLVLESLGAGKHTFVEKPLCIRQPELDQIEAFYENKFGSRIPNPEIPVLMVGFNRRFSKYAVEVKKHTSRRINPLFIHYRMNAGYLPLGHWVHSEEGGGRIIGEACHIIDLFSFLIESPLQTYSVAGLRPKTGSITGSDNKTIVLEYQDGSVATLAYFAVGAKELPKEQLEVHFDEKTIIVDDFKSIRGYGLQVAHIDTRASEKGQFEELEALADCLLGKRDHWPIPWESMKETTEATIALAEF